MLEIETKLINDELQLSVNGVVDPDAFVFKSYHNSKLIAHIYNHTLAQPIYDCTFDELFNIFEDIKLPLEPPLIDEIEDVKIFDDYSFSEGEIYQGNKYIVCSIKPNIEEWNNPWSISEFSNCLQKVANDSKKVEYWVEDYETPLNGYGLQYQILNLNNSVKNELQKVIPLFKEHFQKALDIVRLNIKDRHFITLFNFPEEIKSVCGQYLIYFGQFLNDLGIRANVEIHEQIRSLLFSVTPLNSDDAISRIKEALDVYLELPQNNSLIEYGNNDISVRQLEANIYHLKSQLELSKAILENKNATIIQLNSTLLNYQKYWLRQENQILCNEKTTDASEEIIDGIVKVHAYKKGPLEINIPEIIRKLKRVVFE